MQRKKIDIALANTVAKKMIIDGDPTNMINYIHIKRCFIKGGKYEK